MKKIGRGEQEEEEDEGEEKKKKNNKVKNRMQFSFSSRLPCAMWRLDVAGLSPVRLWTIA